MERYLAEGVCGLISDRPALAADVVSAYESDSQRTFPTGRTNGCGAQTPHRFSRMKAETPYFLTPDNHDIIEQTFKIKQS